MIYTLEGIDPMNAHPFAELFPLMADAELRELADDIRRHGLRLPVTTYGGLILDGRNRYAACQIAEVSPVPSVEFDGTESEAMAFAISMNLPRRHLTESQRGMIAARLATLVKGANQHTPIGGPSIATVTESLHVGEGTVTRAKQVIEHGTPALIAAVDAGQVTVSAAAEVAKLPKAEQKKIVKEGPKAVKAKAAETRKTKAEPVKQSEPAKEESEPADTPAKPYKVPTTDANGIPIQEWAVEAFQAVPEFRDMIRIVKSLRQRLSALADTVGGRYLQRNCQWTTLGKNDDGSERGAWRNDHLENLLMLLEDRVPMHTDCPYAFNPFKPHDDSCNCCKGQRWTPKQHNKNTPRECLAARDSHYGIEGGK